MPGAGSLSVRVVRDHAGTIAAVDLASTRPAVSHLLSRRSPDAALTLAELLFQVCRQAQLAAANAALAAAGWAAAAAPDPARERAVAGELLLEHLWRLLLDWPLAFGLAPARQLFRQCHAGLRVDRPAQDLPVLVLAALEREWLGMPAAGWLAFDELDALHAWSAAADSPAARLCARVARVDSARRPLLAVPLLEDQDAAAIRAGWAHTIDAGFPARPHRGGEPRETGVLCWHAGAPLIEDALRQRPTRVLARLLARIRDTLMVLLGHGGRRIEASGDGGGAGLALVRTARGLLLHQVRLDGGRIASWRVVAPTEWNFHPAGPLVRGLVGLRFPQAPSCERWVRAQLLSLDPCVEYRIGFHHA